MTTILLAYPQYNIKELKLFFRHNPRTFGIRLHPWSGVHSVAGEVWQHWFMLGVQQRPHGTTLLHNGSLREGSHFDVAYNSLLLIQASRYRCCRWRLFISN